MTLVLRYIARSDRGLVRSNNEDSAYAGARLLALADGMGGHAAGEVASQLVIQALRPLDDDEPGDDLLGKLERATHDGNVAIADQVAEAPELDGMGTTLTAILFAGSRIGLCHVGDSRAYLLRDGLLEQITRDDTFVQTLVEEGKITAEQAHSHPQRSLIMKALTGTEVEPTLTIREARAGDRYLLCSDGLSDVVTEETIADTLASIEDHKQCADRLIELALRGGGPDNVTVVVADVVDDQYGESRPILGGAVGHDDDGDYVPDPSTSAGRAAALRPPAPDRRRPSVLTNDEPRPRRPRRTWLIVAVAIVTLLVLVAGAIAARSIIRSSYYVGQDNGNIVIYRGLQSDILGIKMHNVDTVTCVEDFATTSPTVRVLSKSSAPADCRPLRMTDLTPAGRNNVTDYKPSSKGNAERAVQALLSEGTLLPACESQTPTPGVTPPPPGAPGSTPVPAPAPPGQTIAPPPTPAAPPAPATTPVTTSPAAPSGEGPATTTPCREQ